MIADVSLSDEVIASQIHAVLQAGYTSEAATIGCRNFPPLRESLANLRRSSDQFLVYRRDDSIVGVLSFFCYAESVCITRLVVHPEFHRQRIASKLLASLELRLGSATSFAVSTAKDNLPALRLYERLGYALTSTAISVERIRLVYLTKRCQRSLTPIRPSI